MTTAFYIFLIIVVFAAGFLAGILYWRRRIFYNKDLLRNDQFRQTDYEMTFNDVDYKYYVDSPTELVIKKKGQPAFRIEFNNTSEFDTLLFELKELGDKWHREMVSDYWNEIIFGE